MPIVGPSIPANLGQPNGIATLDNGGQLAASQIPDAAINNTYVVNDEPSQLALDANVGDIVVRTDLSKSFILKILPPTSILSWQELLSQNLIINAGVGVGVTGATGPGNSVTVSNTGVLSVNGLTGAVGGIATYGRTISTINGITGGGDLSADRTIQPVYGSVHNTITEGNDPRLSDSRSPTGPAGGDFGGSTYPDPMLSAWQSNAIALQSPSVGTVPTWNGYAWVPATPATGGSGGGGRVYFLNYGVTGESPLTGLPVTTKQFSLLADTSASTFTSAVLPTGGVYATVAGFVTNPLDPGATALPAGLWDFNIWASSPASTSETVFYRVNVYKYDGTSATLIATSETVYLYVPSIVKQYSSSAAFPQTALQGIDRLYIEILASSTSPAQTITLSFGDTTPAHVHTTLPSVTGTGLVHVINGIVQSPATAVNLTAGADITGILPVANGGTGQTTALAVNSTTASNNPNTTGLAVNTGNASLSITDAGHTHPLTDPSHTHTIDSVTSTNNLSTTGLTVNSGSASVSISDPGHSHAVSDDGHTHTINSTTAINNSNTTGVSNSGTSVTVSISDPSHSHTVTDPAHLHIVNSTTGTNNSNTTGVINSSTAVTVSVTDLGHSHSVTDPSHTHTTSATSATNFPLDVLYHETFNVQNDGTTFLTLSDSVQVVTQTPPTTQVGNPRVIAYVFGNSWAGGSVTVTGTDLVGTTITETIPSSVGVTVQGTKQFAFITHVTHSILGPGGGGHTVGITASTRMGVMNWPTTAFRKITIAGVPDTFSFTDTANGVFDTSGNHSGKVIEVWYSFPINILQGSHTHTIGSSSTGVTIASNTTGVTASSPLHTHTVTDPGHNHTQNAHIHTVNTSLTGVTLSNNTTGVTASSPSHTHTVTDPGHNHTQTGHIHTSQSASTGVTVSPNTTGVTTSDSGHSHAVTDPGHNHTQNSHTHSAQSALTSVSVNSNTTGVSVSDIGHAHGVTDTGHNHSQNAHSHTLS